MLTWENDHNVVMNNVIDAINTPSDIKRGAGFGAVLIVTAVRQKNLKQSNESELEARGWGKKCL
jgi:hypothetical protein